jgi:hypothetical protein
MSITATPIPVAVDASSLVILMGLPNRAVSWGLTGSTGTLTVLNSYTDEWGRAAAIFRPGEGDEGSTAIVSAEYGS